MNLYDLNKAALANVPPIEDFTGARKIIADYIEKQSDIYFMLLNNEKHYYTLFRQNKYTAEMFADEVIDIAKELGPVIDITENKATEAVEVWIKYNGEVCMFLFFPYGRGVIEV